MKSEILSNLPETTSVSFLSPGNAFPEKRMPRHAILLTLTLLSMSFFFVSTTHASWLNNHFFSQNENQQRSTGTPIQKQDSEPQAAQDRSVSFSENRTPAPLHQADVFQNNIVRIAEQLFSHLDDPDPQTSLLADGVTCTVFSDLKKLTRTSSFGRYLSEQLMGEFQQRGFPVVEVRKSKAIMVMEKRGEYGLSRDLAEIAETAPARTMLTGTYTLAGDRILVNARLLDNANGTLLSSATVVFDKNELTSALLADTASAYAKKDSFVYMKRLEL